MLKLYSPILAGALIVQTSAVAAPPASRSVVTPDPNRKICQEIGTIGSRLAKKRICATQAEWEAMKQQDKDAVVEAQRSARVGCSVSPAWSYAPVPAC